jgi:serine/threonine protein kinase
MNMTELLKFLSTNSPAALAFAVAVLILAVTVSVMCVVAFVQGRSVSFWPPSIGERPKAHALLESKAEQDEEPFESRTSPPGSSSPVVSRNTTLQGASGITYRVTSGFYGGANATLYKAEDQKGAAVIAKVYWRGLAPNSPPWELFQQEQRTAEILNHRNIVKTLDRGLRMGYPFTIIEYLGGGTLRDWLRVHDRLPGRDIASIASQLADAIDYAHSRGVIHRDIKPGNVLFESDPNGRVALSDFGIAAILGAVERDITAIGGEFNGSPGYLAPELVVGDSPKGASDIYSFGVVVFEMIAGTVPFDEYKEPLAIIRAKTEKDAPDIRQFRPDVPETVAMQLRSVLARQPALRPASARLALAGIEEWLAFA